MDRNGRRPSKLSLRKLSTSLGILFALAGALGMFVGLRVLLRSSPKVALEKAPAPAASPPPICQNFHKAICQSRRAPKDPTGSVRPDIEGELRALRILQSLIHAHPDWSKERIDEALVQQIYTPARTVRIREADQWVRKAMETFLDTYLPQDASRLKERIRATQLELPPPAKTYADEPDLFTKNDVYYERTGTGKTRLRVGGAYLFTAKSWFNLVFTIGHELGHAIDPCEMTATGQIPRAYDHLSRCFLAVGIVASRMSRTQCVEHDQLAESFADWIAVHLTAQAIAEVGANYTAQQRIDSAVNSVRDLCEQEVSLDRLDFENHPSPEIRIDRIFGRNPAVRQLLGCGPPEPLVPYDPTRTLFCNFEESP